MPFPVGAAIAAAASLAGTGASMIQTGKLNKKGRAFTQEQNALNRQQTWDMWNATNEFNLEVSDPAFQMKRYKDAGLNPWLIYGQPQDVSASNMSTQQFANPDLKSADIDIDKAFAAFMQTKMQQKQLESMDADIAAKNANANNANASAALTTQQTQQQAELFGGQKTMQSLDIAGKGLSNDTAVKNLEKIGVDLDKSRAEIQNIKQNYARGIVEINNLQKAGKIADAELKSKEIALKLGEATLGSKIKAENALNDLIIKSGGMSKVGASALPSLFIGTIVQEIKELFPLKKEERKERQEYIRDMINR